MKNLLHLLLLLILASGISCNKSTIEPVDSVNPCIGNISHLLVPTYPTVHLPNSMLRFCPNRNDFTSNQIDGFSLNLVSHRSEKVFTMYPFVTETEEYPFRYTYDNEKITPYNYQVTLDEYGIKVEFAPASKSGFFTLSFDNPGEGGLVLKANGYGELTFNGTAVTGYDTYRDIKAYLYLEPDKKPDQTRLWSRDSVMDSPSAEGSGTGLVLLFKQLEKGNLKIRYGISWISVDQARKNMEKEITSWDINTVAENARKTWNKTLSQIEVEGGSPDQRSVFYTALYRCFERMTDITEDGRYYSAWSGRVESADDTVFYTDDWIWDTHLALHPLQMLLNPDQQDEKISSYIRMARQSGWMPTFPTISGDNHAMNGNHAAAMILDSWNKGIKGYDLEEAYNHLKKTILYETKLPWVKGEATPLDEFYDKNGYFPGLRKGEEETVKEVHPFEKRQSVAVTLASCYDDWCMAQMAEILGKKEDYDFFIKRSLNYRNLFNTETGFYHPKDSEGKWIEPFDYRFDGGMGARDYYDENNGWTYLWQPYHAFDDLIEMMGGKEKFEQKLDQLFTVGLGRSKWQYYATMPDATGNVGQFVMGNEPSMHIPYLYNLADKPWKTQKRVRMLMDTWFRNDLMGIPGDEDGGGLSAFYVFSAMGFYPITPGVPEYQIGSPVFSQIKIRLQNGNIFTIRAENNSNYNKYITSAILNGRPFNKTTLTHSEILDGGTLILMMGSGPPNK